ncbi:unnamed protein product, partial [Phaeothamnion confervicola]
LVARLALDAGLLEVAGRCYQAAADHPTSRAAALEGKGLLTSDTTPILQKMAHVYRDMEEPTQARQCLLQALERSPDHLICLLQLASVCQHLRLYADALAATLRAYSLDKSQAHLRRDILALHQLMGHREEARQVLDSELRELDPAEPAYLD